jgi:hypothetical protein
MKDLQYTGIDNVFFLEKSCTKMYTIFSAVQRQQRKSDIMTSFGLTACSAVYYHAGSSLTCISYVTDKKQVGGNKLHVHIVLNSEK